MVDGLDCCPKCVGASEGVKDRFDRSAQPQGGTDVLSGIDVSPDDQVSERFWSKVHPTGFCWEWTAGKNADGYGMFGVPKRDGSGGWTKVSAHRYAYEILIEPIPPGLVVDHLCQNPGCVNPDHLQPVTHMENVLRSPKSTARNTNKQQCDHGHLLCGDNVRKDKRGRRVCVPCAQRRAKEWARTDRARKKAA